MQREWKTEYVENGQLRTPKFFRDWKWGLRHVLAGARKRPIMVTLLVLLNWIDASEIVKIPLVALRIPEAIMMQFVYYEILMASWKDLQVSEPEVLDNKEEKDPREAREMAARLFGTNFCYGLGTLFLLCLLIAPGIWFAVTRCLGVAIVVIEKQQPGVALGLSDELVKGHFWRTFRYNLFFPVGLMVAATLPVFIVQLIITLLFGEAIATAAEKVAIIFVYSIIFVYELSVMPLIIYMYAFLREQKRESIPMTKPVA